MNDDFINKDYEDYSVKVITKGEAGGYKNLEKLMMCFVNVAIYNILPKMSKDTGRSKWIYDTRVYQIAHFYAQSKNSHEFGRFSPFS